MTLFISDNTDAKRKMGKTAFIYLLISLFCVLFGAIYEYFSHDVYSYYMLYAFIFPLAGGVLPFAHLALGKRTTKPRWVPEHLYHYGIATLTIGSFIKGILDIYGTSSHLVTIYWNTGIILVGCALILYFYDQMKTSPTTDK